MQNLTISYYDNSKHSHLKLRANLGSLPGDMIFVLKTEFSIQEGGG